MIVRERMNEFVMIEQDHHAGISGEIFSCWKDGFFKGEKWRESVLHAVTKHDCGWRMVDRQPFWNDQKQAPYTFMDFPSPAKTLIYNSGIDEVERRDRYAALLCSEHYVRFKQEEESPEAKQFVQFEKARQQRLIKSISDFGRSLFAFHYGLLQLCDNLSLYLCLNEPGAKKEEESPFFQNGIPLSGALDVFSKKKMHARWIDRHTIGLDEFPLKQPVTVNLKQKTVSKELISKQGLIPSYLETPEETVEIHLVPYI
ncbi:DUF3891 family protein [Siminovitchia sp. 179-K 8D1 HS]|uniref:DUF3891 family protein n=1 Tax=Siminovitchia sp. 179-K 8D1 HS TaxID=3142385 RepID=UPI0039A1C208